MRVPPWFRRAMLRRVRRRGLPYRPRHATASVGRWRWPVCAAST